MEPIIIDKSSSTPFYMQLRHQIQNAIRQGELLPNQQLPSETKLLRMTGLSRMTVRQALQTLITEGWLFTVQGKGTFVTDRPNLEQNLQCLMGWTEEAISQGFHPSTKLISTEIVKSNPSLFNNENLFFGEQVIKIVRVRYAENFPLALEISHLPYGRLPEIEKLITIHESLYDILREHYGICLIRGVQYIDVGEANKFTAEHLNILIGDPVLSTTRISYLEDNTPIEYTIAFHHAGMVRFRTELNSQRNYPSLTTREINIGNNNYRSD